MVKASGFGERNQGDEMNSRKREGSSQPSAAMDSSGIVSSPSSLCSSSLFSERNCLASPNSSGSSTPSDQAHVASAPSLHPLPSCDITSAPSYCPAKRWAPSLRRHTAEEHPHGTNTKPTDDGQTLQQDNDHWNNTGKEGEGEVLKCVDEYVKNLTAFDHNKVLKDTPCCYSKFLLSPPTETLPSFLQAYEELVSEVGPTSPRKRLLSLFGKLIPQAELPGVIWRVASSGFSHSMEPLLSVRPMHHLVADNRIYGPPGNLLREADAPLFCPLQYNLYLSKRALALLRRKVLICVQLIVPTECLGLHARQTPKDISRPLVAVNAYLQNPKMPKVELTWARLSYSRQSQLCQVAGTADAVREFLTFLLRAMGNYLKAQGWPQRITHTAMLLTKDMVDSFPNGRQGLYRLLNDAVAQHVPSPTCFFLIPPLPPPASKDLRAAMEKSLRENNPDRAPACQRASGSSGVSSCGYCSSGNGSTSSNSICGKHVSCGEVLGRWVCAVHVLSDVSCSMLVMAKLVECMAEAVLDNRYSMRRRDEERRRRQTGRGDTGQIVVDPRFTADKELKQLLREIEGNDDRRMSKWTKEKRQKQLTEEEKMEDEYKTMHEKDNLKREGCGDSLKKNAAKLTPSLSTKSNGKGGYVKALEEVVMGAGSANAASGDGGTERRGEGRRCLEDALTNKKRRWLLACGERPNGGTMEEERGGNCTMSEGNPEQYWADEQQKEQEEVLCKTCEKIETQFRVRCGVGLLKSFLIHERAREKKKFLGDAMSRSCLEEHLRMSAPAKAGLLFGDRGDVVVSGYVAEFVRNTKGAGLLLVNRPAMGQAVPPPPGLSIEEGTNGTTTTARDNEEDVVMEGTCLARGPGRVKDELFYVLSPVELLGPWAEEVLGTLALQWGSNEFGCVVPRQHRDEGHRKYKLRYMGKPKEERK
eukprot:GHVS01021608.1.p1 GENE.GHVS01021608.1~~GHVS01021608.1.p1  ORF type:complete len:927 (+),score=161.16 GHVS01021608.1:245-3025(+)